MAASAHPYCKADANSRAYVTNITMSEDGTGRVGMEQGGISDFGFRISDLPARGAIGRLEPSTRASAGGLGISNAG
jgi:hypothetical protein